MIDKKKLIYVSTGHFYKQDIKDTVKNFIEHGFENIEISCGKVENGDLRILKQYVKSGIRIRLHNYFPALQNDFVLNLASTDSEIRKNSRNHIMNAINWSSELCSDYYAFHAGFRLCLHPEELGNTLKLRMQMASREKAKTLFLEELELIREYAIKSGVNLGIENNVYSLHNYEQYGEENPFLFCCDDASEINFLDSTSILLDVGHLKVSANTLNFDPHDVFRRSLEAISCIHYSDNNGLTDSNGHLREDSWFWSLDLRKIERHTIEVYDNDLSSLRCDWELLSMRLNDAQ